MAVNANVAEAFRRAALPVSCMMMMVVIAAWNPLYRVDTEVSEPGKKKLSEPGKER